MQVFNQLEEETFEQTDQGRTREQINRTYKLLSWLIVSGLVFAWVAVAVHVLKR